MKKKFKKILGVMLSTAMVMTPMMETIAASNNFDVTAEEVSGKVLFPGDSVSGVQPIYMGPDGAALEVVDGKWTNDTAQAYSMSGFEGEGGGLWLEPKGYVLTVNDGTSKVTGTDGSDRSNHFKAKEGSEGDWLFSKDVAYYSAWTDVTITANPAPEGQIFDHWEIESGNVSLTDSYAAETNFAMAEDEVILSAVYVDAPVETEPPTEAPAVEETQPVTEAPVVEETQPVTEAPAEETQPATDPLVIVEETQPVTEAPAVEETQPVTETPVLYNLSVENGSGSGDYEVGSVVTVTADTVEGMEFAGWTTESVSVWFSDASSAQTTFPMPAEHVSIKANFIPAQTGAPETEPVEEIVPDQNEVVVVDEVENASSEAATEAEEVGTVPNLYTVEVEFGEGGGYYEAGAEVVVYADAPEEGQEFAGWVTSENLVLEDPSNEEAIFTMPADEVKLTATYKAAQTEAVTEAPVEDVIIEEEITEADDNAAEGENGEAVIVETEEWYEDTQDVYAEPEAGTEAETEVFVEETEAETEVIAEETEVETEAQTEQAAVMVDPQQIQLSNNADVTIVTADGELELDEYGIPVFVPGDTVTIKATEYEDKVLDFWTLTKADGSKEAITPTIDPEDPYVASFIMPNAPVYVEAHYTVLNDNEVQIVNGSGSGIYLEGDYVEIEADEPAEGYRFKGWKVITGNVALDDDTSAVTGFEMPAEAVQIKAVYEVERYTLTVENGSGGGSYVKGETVNLTANYPASGKVFAGWTVTTENASVASSDRYYSSITMPAANVTVKATYKDGPSPAYNVINDIVSGGEYLKGQTISFTAVGNGMENTNPNPGDYRYRPVGYQIGSVSGNWSNSPYTTRMAINAVGKYTLTVNYSKDIFDGSNWVADGSYDSKSVDFYVVNALSVQTGDSSPIIPLIAAAVVALLVIVVLMVVRIKRRRRY